MFLAAIRADFVDLFLFLVGLLKPSNVTVGDFGLFLWRIFLYLSLNFLAAILAFLFSLTSSRFKSST